MVWRIPALDEPSSSSSSSSSSPVCLLGGKTKRKRGICGRGILVTRETGLEGREQQQLAVHPRVEGGRRRRVRGILKRV